MKRGVAKALCQQFLWSGLMYNTVDPSSRSFRDRGLWQLTPKGLVVLADFCRRTQTDHFLLDQLVDRGLVTLERSDDDQLMLNRQNMASLFRTMVNGLSTMQDNNTQQSDGGSYHGSKRNSVSSSHSSDSAPGLSSSSSVSSSSSSSSNHLNDRFQLLDNKLLQSVTSAQQTPSSSPTKRLRVIFSTQMCCDWLVSCCTMASRDEAEFVTNEFLRHGWINYQNENDQLDQPMVEASKGTLMVITVKGRNLVLDTMQPVVNTTSPHTSLPTTDGSSARLDLILHDAQLRSLFSDFLRANFCSENLDFWIDYTNLRRKCKSQNPAMPSQNQKDLLEDAYAIWTNYLCPGAPWELNVDHDLQNDMARLVPSMMKRVPHAYASTVIVNTSSQSNSQCLRTLLKRFERVETQICRLMSADSVPKFVSWLQIYQKKEKLPSLENGLRMLKA
ncbi:regulator of G protein signaling domain-containing protein [Chlamydoabsidia padenii]|nr:regulator of G protein signaling domain-containing protein [Chlamydoabsidia padenii]